MTIMNKTLLAASALLMSSTVSAGIINGGTYLDHAGADQLETWLGVGDQNFTNIWSGITGASSVDWHSAVDGAGPTFSIYEMTIHDGSTAYIGGYTELSWAGGGYAFDTSAFIFNLTSGEIQRQSLTDSQYYGNYSVSRSYTTFATFGGGWDLFGSLYNLGRTTGGPTWGGHTKSFTYSISKGQISVEGDSGLGDGDSGISHLLPHVTGLQTFTFADAATVPEPHTIILMGLGLAGLGFARRRQS